MSRATPTSDSDAELPEQSEGQFNATDDALPWGKNLRGTDRRNVRQFIENLRSEKFANFNVERIYRGDHRGTLRVVIAPKDRCMISMRNGERAASDTPYTCTTFMYMRFGNLAYHLKDE